jgi:hypothetical protein
MVRQVSRMESMMVRCDTWEKDLSGTGSVPSSDSGPRDWRVDLDYHRVPRASSFSPHP